MMKKKIVLYCKNVMCVTICFSSNASALYSQRGVCPCTESIFTAIYYSVHRLSGPKYCSALLMYSNGCSANDIQAHNSTLNSGLMS